MTEYAALVILAPVSIDKLFQHNVVAGQCPGLIGAKNVHRPEILDGVEVLDNGVSPTATEMAKIKASNQSPFVTPLMRNTRGTITSMKRISKRLTLLIPLSNAVCARTPTILRAMVPR